MEMIFKLGLITLTCLVWSVASTPQYYDTGYPDPYVYNRQIDPSYSYYDPSYYPENTQSRIRSVKPDSQKGAVPPARKPDSSKKGPKGSNGQDNPLNGQPYPSDLGSGLPNGQGHQLNGVPKAPNGQTFPINSGAHRGYGNGGAYPNGPDYSTSGQNKPGFEAHYSDSQSYSGTQGRVNYQTNIQNNFHYIENTERNVYVIPPNGNARKVTNSKGNKNKQDKERSASWW